MKSAQLRPACFSVCFSKSIVEKRKSHPVHFNLFLKFLISQILSGISLSWNKIYADMINVDAWRKWIGLIKWIGQSNIYWKYKYIFFLAWSLTFNLAKNIKQTKRYIHKNTCYKCLTLMFTPLFYIHFWYLFSDNLVSFLYMWALALRK